MKATNLLLALALALVFLVNLWLLYWNFNTGVEAAGDYRKVFSAVVCVINLGGVYFCVKGILTLLGVRYGKEKDTGQE